MKVTSSTAVMVKVQHSDEVHPLCDAECKTLPTKVTIPACELCLNHQLQLLRYYMLGRNDYFFERFQNLLG